MRSRIVSNCAAETCCGLCATSSSTRSSSSSTLASAVSPCSNAVCRYKRFSSSKSSARRCSEAMFTCLAPELLSGSAFASSTSTISERPRCSPTAMIRTRSRTLAASATVFVGPTRRPARNATSTSAATAENVAKRRGWNNPDHPETPAAACLLSLNSRQRRRFSGSRGAICFHTR